MADDLASTGLVVFVDKPSGPSSHDIVARVRRDHGIKRVGHAGTLDPFATGLLIVLVGREATREQARFMSLRKTYRVRARLGAISTTGDRDGEIIETGKVPSPEVELPAGEIRQRPPAYSAVKVRGERAYKRARRGEAIEMPERIVTVHRFEELHREAEHAEYEVECSSGTYVRSLIADLGDGYCEELRRTAIGPFTLDDATSGAGPVPVAEALARAAGFEHARVASR
ncbi:MAG: tRNA pseudouridine(55) synthase TruB [Actinomycetota bacterium]|nr:tRNA pseudouridine(55) synthase TruB [Actinomycetota bacterium]